LAAKPSAGPGWVHDIKHDGDRLIVRRDGNALHLFTRRGYDWTARYPRMSSCFALSVASPDYARTLKIFAATLAESGRFT
jgi:ATP-dependent DNA ligase